MVITCRLFFTGTSTSLSKAKPVKCIWFKGLTWCIKNNPQNFWFYWFKSHASSNFHFIRLFTFHNSFPFYILINWHPNLPWSLIALYEWQDSGCDLFTVSCKTEIWITCPSIPLIQHVLVQTKSNCTGP